MAPVSGGLAGIAAQQRLVVPPGDAQLQSLTLAIQQARQKAFLVAQDPPAQDVIVVVLVIEKTDLSAVRAPCAICAGAIAVSPRCVTVRPERFGSKGFTITFEIQRPAFRVFAKLAGADDFFLGGGGHRHEQDQGK